MGRGWKGRGDPPGVAERFGCGWILSGLEGARAWELGYGQSRLGNSPVPKAVWVGSSPPPHQRLMDSVLSLVEAAAGLLRSFA